MDFLRAKAEGRKLSMVTCYDYTFGRLLSKSPIDGILVGDSAAMVMQGHPSTLSASTELMRLHTEAVVRRSGQIHRRGHAVSFFPKRVGCGSRLGIDPDGRRRTRS